MMSVLRGGVVFAAGIAWLFGAVTECAVGAWAQDDPCPPNILLTQVNWVRFDVVMGRVLATCTRTKQDRHRLQEVYPSGARESVSVSIDRGLISMRYMLQSERHQLTVDVMRRDQLDIDWRYRDEHEKQVAVSYFQRGSGDVVLRVTVEEQPSQEYRAASLWHLLLRYPQVCRAHVIPIIEGMRPNWNIERDLQSIHRQLLHVANGPPATSRADVKKLVARLSDSQFQVRLEADRRLRALGPAAYCFLSQLAADDLDSEQALHLRSILQRPDLQRPDTPRRVAIWLSNDPLIWLSIARSDDVSDRKIACGQLERLLGKEGNLDPTASPRVRSARWAELHQRLIR